MAGNDIMDTERRKIELGNNYYLFTETHFHFPNEKESAYQTSGRLTSSSHWLFLNGLSDSIDSWTEFRNFFFKDEFEKSNYTFIDLRSQGQALETSLQTNNETHFQFSVHTHVDDILNYLKSNNLHNFKLNVVGNSFGGAIALALACRIEIENLYLMVPYTIRLDHSFPMQRLVRWQWDMSKRMGLIPSFVTQPIEKNYKKFLTHYMNFRFENRLKDPAYRRAAIEQTYGILNFNALNQVQNLKCKKVHLISSQLDTLVPQTLYREFWNLLPDNIKFSWLQIENGEHLLLEQAPKFVSDWIRLLSTEQETIQKPLVLRRKIEPSH